MCVCVCVFSIHYGASPTDQLETCMSFLHFTVYSGDYIYTSQLFCPSQPTGVTQEGENTEVFSSFYFSLIAHPPLRCLPSFFLWRQGFSRPFPSSRKKSNFVYSRSFKLFSFYRFPLPGTRVRKNPLSPRFEPVTWSLDGCVDTTPRPPGRPASHAFVNATKTPT